MEIAEVPQKPVAKASKPAIDGPEAAAGLVGGVVDGLKEGAKEFVKEVAGDEMRPALDRLIPAAKPLTIQQIEEKQEEDAVKLSQVRALIRQEVAPAPRTRRIGVARLRSGPARTPQAKLIASTQK